MNTFQLKDKLYITQNNHLKLKLELNKEVIKLLQHIKLTQFLDLVTTLVEAQVQELEKLTQPLLIMVLLAILLVVNMSVEVKQSLEVNILQVEHLILLGANTLVDKVHTQVGDNIPQVDNLILLEVNMVKQSVEVNIPQVVIQLEMMDINLELNMSQEDQVNMSQEDQAIMFQEDQTTMLKLSNIELKMII